MMNKIIRYTDKLLTIFGETNFSIDQMFNTITLLLLLLYTNFSLSVCL